MIKSKICTKCGIDKLLKEYYKENKKSKDGLRCYCKSCCSKNNKKSYFRNKENVSKYGKKYREENKEHISNIKAKRYIEVIKPNYDNKKDEINTGRNKRYKNRMKEDINFKIKKVCVGRIQLVIKRQYGLRAFKSIELLGCTIKECKSYLENQFTKGMTWSNQGKWHIDHITPCASFDLTDPKQQKSCFHYTNLQPLWAKDNYSKGSKILI